ncbi:MAG: class I SAM-dependent methyltransferase [Pseudomonadota bacterium]
MNYDEAPPFSVSRYREMQKALPGVDALQRLVCAHLEAASPSGGMVLVVGAGGGREVEAIAASMLPFRITGVDPSIAMLDIARTYVPKANAREVVFVHGGVSDVSAPPGGFDAATNLLVTHFLPDDDGPDGKTAHLAAIRARLRAGACYLHADVSYDAPADLSAMKAVHMRHAALAGLSEEDAACGPAIIANMPIISAARTEALLRATGFGASHLFFQTLWYRAWVSRAI